MHFSLWIFNFHPHILILLSFKSHYYKNYCFWREETYSGPGVKPYLALVPN